MAGKKGERTPKTVTPTVSNGGYSDIDVFLASKAHPLAEEINEVRKLMRSVSSSIREEIKWGSVSFRNENDFFGTIHLREPKAVQLILHTGVKRKATAETGIPVDDPAGIIEKWLAKDRCLVSLGAGSKFKANRGAFQTLVAGWIRFV